MEEEIKQPPEQTKKIIDTTVDYIVRNDIHFEAELKKRNASSNKKFGFLFRENEFYPYYRQLLEGRLEPEQVLRLKQLRVEEEVAAQKAEAARSQTTSHELTLKDKILQEMKLLRIPKESYIKQPKLNKYTVTVPAKASQSQIDIIKLTAQFVARNGKKFLANLSQKEQTNPEWSFLDPADPSFPYFQKLVTAYVTCIVPPQNLMQNLKNDCNYMQLLLGITGQAEWARQEDERREQKEQDEEEERLQMQLIDWHRFVVLETLEFNEGEVYPPPGRNLAEINEILDSNNRGEINVTLAPDVNQDEEMDMDIEEESSEGEQEMDMDMEGDEDSDDEVKALPPAAPKPTYAPAPAAEPRAPVPPTKTQDGFVVADEDLAAVPQLETKENLEMRRRIEEELKRRAADSQSVQSPFTGDWIPLKDISEHIRIMLLNPKWKEQKELLVDKMRTTSLADNNEIARNLAVFADRRAELTGGKGAPKEAPGPRSSGWDGHQNSKRSATRDAEKRDKKQEKRNRQEQQRIAKEQALQQSKIEAEASKFAPSGSEPPTKKRMLQKGVVKQITVRLPDGKSIFEQVDIGDKVSDVRGRIASQMGVKPETISLVDSANTAMDLSLQIGTYKLDGPIFCRQ